MGFVANNISSSRYSIERKYHLSSDFENFLLLSILLEWYLFLFSSSCHSELPQSGRGDYDVALTFDEACGQVNGRKENRPVRSDKVLRYISVGDLSVRQSDSSVNKLENFYRFPHIPSDRYDHHNI